MAIVLPIIHQEYTRFQTLFGPSLLGIIEIGSFAHKEAIQRSDHDLRLIIRSDDPLFVFDEYAWTEPIADTATTVRWSDLNQHAGISFGLTNLAYIERMLPTGRYPLLDHTCLYQGCILTELTKPAPLPHFATNTTASSSPTSSPIIFNSLRGA